jgi:lysophospholipase L1-like esterase
MAHRAPILLFQGDSITDADRQRENSQPNHPAAMGTGYAYLAMCRWLARYPRDQYRVFNRGISGNRVADLAARWQSDTLAFAPTILSILIGINDLWHMLDGQTKGTPADYRAEYDALLATTRRALPETRLVVCEPFVLPAGVVDERWFPEFEQRRAIAEELAARHGATWVPFHRNFESAIARGSHPEYWAADGVHPTAQGHYLMADAWCSALGA